MVEKALDNELISETLEGIRRANYDERGLPHLRGKDPGNTVTDEEGRDHRRQMTKKGRQSRSR